MQKFANTFANFCKLLALAYVAANHVGEMHEMNISYIFIALTDHRSNDFQNSPDLCGPEGEVMNDVTQLACEK